MESENDYQLGLNYYYGEEGCEKNLNLAIFFFSRAAKVQHSGAQFALGQCYSEMKNEKRAFQMFRYAANQNNAFAINSLGLCYEYGMGVKKNRFKAFKLYKLSAQKGNCIAITNLAVCYEEGEVVKKDMKEAIRLYQLAANQKDGLAKAYLGNCYEMGNGVKQNLAEAISLYQSAANQGNSYARWRLAICYYQGKGVPMNSSTALQLLELAAKQGHEDALNDLAVLHELGIMEKDFQKAKNLYILAASKGSVLAQLNLGRWYVSGKDGKVEEEKAKLCFELAATQGNAEGQYKVGLCHEKKRNFQQAYKFYNLSAFQGYQNAQNKIIYYNENGLGTPKDLNQARYLKRKFEEC